MDDDRLKLEKSSLAEISKLALELIDDLEKIENRHDKSGGDTIVDKEEEEKVKLVSDCINYETVCETIENTCHFPLICTGDFLRRKSQMEMAKEDIKSAGLSLLYSQSLSFSHQVYKLLFRL